jgi:hypothetical protein
VKAFLDVRYRPSDAVTPPARLCVKGGFRPEMRQIMAVGYQTEALFYRDLGAKLSAGLPECYFADVDETEGQGVVVMDDLVAEHVRFGDAKTPLSVDQAAEGLAIQAAWHSATGFELPWLAPPSNLRGVAQAVLTPESWEAQLAQENPESVRAALGERERYVRGLERTWELEDAGPRCITHGDANLTNIYINAEGRLRFVDWQFVAMSDWAHDVGLFLIGAISVDDRRAHERELLRGYLAARGQGGTPVPAWDEAWENYRRHTLHGLLYALTPNEMQPADVRAALGERYAHAALDHDTYSLLGV